MDGWTIQSLNFVFLYAVSNVLQQQTHNQLDFPGLVRMKEVDCGGEDEEDDGGALFGSGHLGGVELSMEVRVMY